MDENKLRKYKTVMCQRMLRNGTCRYGLLCDFAHDDNELRRNLNQHWYYGVKCEKDGCKEKECRFAHSDMEVMYHPHIYKTKLCQNFAKPTGCPKKNYCSFAHGRHELRQPKFHSGGGFSDEGGVGAPSAVSPPMESFFAQSEFQTASAMGSNNISSNSSTSANAAALSFASSSYENGLKSPDSSVESLLAGVNLSDVNDFRDATDQLKIRILDIVDQISGMHYERALLEHDKARSLYANESAKMNAMLQESYATVQKQQQEQFALGAQLEQANKHIHELSEQLARMNDMNNELKHELDLFKGVSSSADLSRLSRAALEKMEEDQNRILLSIRQAKERQRQHIESKSNTEFSKAEGSSS